MNTHYLTSLFTPDKIALFGASDRENSVGGVVFRNLLSAGFEGKILHNSDISVVFFGGDKLCNAFPSCISSFQFGMRI